jgi:hypothetical protein
MVNAEQKKRKLDGDDQHDHPARVVSVKVKHEISKHTAVLVVPPNASTLSPIHKLIVVDLWSDDAKAVEQALTELGDFVFPPMRAGIKRTLPICTVRELHPPLLVP